MMAVKKSGLGRGLDALFPEKSVPSKSGAKDTKEKTAVAIAYEPGERAPKILATGKGQVAEKIIEKTKESQVPTYKDN